MSWKNRPLQEALAMRSDKVNSARSLGDFEAMINRILGESQAAGERSERSLEEIFGPEMQAIIDQINAASGQTKEAVTRAGMVNPDSSGTSAAALLNVDTSAGRQRGGVASNFAMQAQRVREGDLNRALQLLMEGSQGKGNIFSILKNQEMFNQQRRDQMKQAKRQQNMDLLGGGLSALSNLCWVAEVLYGKDSEATKKIRAYCQKHINEDSAMGNFCRLYEQNGREWAENLSRMYDSDPDRQWYKKIWRGLWVCAHRDLEWEFDHPHFRSSKQLRELNLLLTLIGNFQIITEHHHATAK